jgi:hypothetical protein
MKLDVLDRVTLLGILPPSEGNYVTFKVLTNLKAELSFSEKEIKDYEIVQKPVEVNGKTEERIFWNNNKAKEKDIEIGEQANKIIQDALKKLDEAGKINEQNASLYEKFMK